MTGDQEQVLGRCRKLATQVDELAIAMGQRDAPATTPGDAVAILRSMAPLTQALVRYQLRLLNSLVPPGQ